MANETKLMSMLREAYLDGVRDTINLLGSQDRSSWTNHREAYEVRVKELLNGK